MQFLKIFNKNIEMNKHFYFKRYKRAQRYILIVISRIGVFIKKWKLSMNLNG